MQKTKNILGLNWKPIGIVMKNMESCFIEQKTQKSPREFIYPIYGLVLMAKMLNIVEYFSLFSQNNKHTNS